MSRIVFLKSFLEERSSLFDDFMDIAEDQSVDIFKEFDKALAEYEEDLLASENDNVDNVDGMPGGQYNT